jgi:hypothetical protein
MFLLLCHKCIKSVWMIHWNVFVFSIQSCDNNKKKIAKERQIMLSTFFFQKSKIKIEDMLFACLIFNH